MSFVFFVIGCVAVGLAFLMRKKYREAAQWPFVEGQIVESRYGANEGASGFSLTIRYAYQVARRSFENNKISWSGQSGSDMAIRALCEKYPEKAPVRVFYNPDNPADSVLENDTSSLWMAVAATGLGFMIISRFM